MHLYSGLKIWLLQLMTEFLNFLQGFSQAATVRGPPMPKGILKLQCDPDGIGNVPKQKPHKVQWDPKSGKVSCWWFLS